MPLWFPPASLRALCDSGPWARGMDLFRGGKVRQLNVVPLDDHWLLEGEVQGSQPLPYEVSIEMGLMPNGEVDFWHGRCTCPVGRQCKHGVALMVHAAHQGAPVSTMKAQVAMPGRSVAGNTVRQEVQGRIAEIHRLEAEAQLVNWLLALERAGVPAIGQAGKGRDERPEQCLYLLSVVGAPRTAPRLQLEAVVSYPKVTGGWAKPRQLRTPPAKGQAVYDSATDNDRQVLQLLRAMPHSHSYYSAYSAAPCAVLEGQVGLLAVQQAAATGRLYADAGGSTVGAALRWGEPLSLAWDWQEAPAARGGEAAWALRARLPSPTATLCLNSPPVYLDTALGLCGPVQAQGLAPAQVEVLLQAPPFAIEALRSRQAEVAQRLGAAIPLPPVLQALQRLNGIAPRACLHLTPTPVADVPRHGRITAQLCFDYQGHRGWWAQGPTAVLVEGAGGRVLLQRDLAAEGDALARLHALGIESLGSGGVFGIPGPQPQQAWLEWADEGFAVLRDAGFDLTTDAALDGWIARAPEIAVRLDAQGGDEATSPWFALSLGVEIDGRRHDILPWLPDLIAAAAAQPPDPATGLPTLPPHVFLQAPGGQGFVRLPTQALRPWMAALLELVGERAHDFTQGSLKLSRLEALRTSAVLGEGVVWEGADALRALARQLQGRAALPEVPVPPGVQASLRPYQQQGLNWLQFLRAHGLAGILADDMGLGKTLQTLAHIQVEKDAGRLTAPALVIAPVSLMGNWRREAERFCPGLRSLVLHGKDRHAVAHAMTEYDLVIAPYSLLQRDRERWLAAQWHLVVLDEAQNIKNASTHAAQVAASLQARHRLCLSGTPMENHLGEIWSLFHFLMPGFLGSQQRFKTLFRQPIEKQGDSERLAQLRARVTPFMLRRTKALVAHELPPKVDTVMPVELTGAQADLYETIRLGMEKTVREALATKGLARSQVTILDALLKLRQVCCDPRLVPLDAARQVTASAKLEQLMELLPEMLAEGRRVLLFSQFTGMLSLIEAELKQRGLPWVKLTGQSQKRDALIEQFTSGRVPLFLISLKAGGVGLNLPQADTVIHYDPWWNPAVEAQATDRAHRIGQTQSVWVVKLVAQGTIEERILEMQERKAQLAGRLYSGAAGRKEPLFTEGDLAELLKPLS